MRRARLGFALLLGAVAVGGAVVPAADAHTGDNLARPILEKVSPKAAEGLEVEIVYTANFQFLLTNPTGQELTVYAQAGEPFIRIGPEGTFGNFKSKSWYNSNSPDGLQKFPEGAVEGPDSEVVWRRVAKEPTWGWFDHRLHPVERYLTKDVLESPKAVKLGEWKVPIKLGDDKGNLVGAFEYKPALGQYKSRLSSSDKLADGITVAVVSASKVPALYIQNDSYTPNGSPQVVTVLGKEGEPFIRIGPKVEVNLFSPSYVEIHQAKGETPPREADASATPEWKEVQASPRWSWLEFRAAPPSEEPSQEIATRDTPTQVSRWEIPVLIGTDRKEIVGVTEFVPIAQIREESRGSGSGGGGGQGLPIIILGLLAVTGVVGYVVLKPKKKEAPVETRHRSRATPKKKR